MEELCKKALYAVALATMIASMWVSAEAKSMEALADRKYWSAKDPELAYRLAHMQEPQTVSMNEVE